MKTEDDLSNASLRTETWEARKAEIAAKNDPEYENEKEIRASGFTKILRSITWGPVVNTFKGGLHALVGLYSIGAGIIKGAIGIVTGDEERKKDSIELLKAGARAVITGATAPVVGIFSDLYDGAHRISTGKRALTTLESEIEVQATMIQASMDGKKKFIKHTEENADSNRDLNDAIEMMRTGIMNKRLEEKYKKSIENQATPGKESSSAQKESSSETIVKRPRSTAEHLISASPRYKKPRENTYSR